MDERALSYFSSVNPIARKIIKDEIFLRNAVGEQWRNLDLKQQEDLIDDFIVDVKVREIYAAIEKTDSYPLSFPKLKVDTGERINVEFEDDCWTWQDEHSSPFNWRTKSQQDLTLDDLEPEALGKAPAKPKRKDSDAQQQQPQPETADGVVVKLAPQEFTVQSANSIWDSPFLQGVKKPEFLNRSRSASPSKSASASRESLTNRSRSPEEVNYAFAGSVDDLSSTASLKDTDRSMSISSGEALSSSPSHKPKPPRRQRSFSKSPIKTVLSGSKKPDSEALVSDKNDEEHAFDNPAIGNEWSTFVNDNPGSALEPSSAASTPSKRLLKEPEPVSMDRGDNLAEDLTDGLAASDEFKDEILVVEVPSPTVDSPKGLDEPDAMNTSSVSKSGFDFLDNW